MTGYIVGMRFKKINKVADVSLGKNALANVDHGGNLPSDDAGVGDRHISFP